MFFSQFSGKHASLCFIVLSTFILHLFIFDSAAAQEHCGKPADVIFLLDDSRSIWYKDFEKERDFVVALVSKFDISDVTTRVGAATFSSGVREEFRLGEYNNRVGVQLAVSQITQSNGGTTDTFTGIKFVRESLFKDARPGVPRILIIITDGDSHDRAETLRQATATINEGITIIVIGVGTMDKVQLAEMASKPTSEYLFTVSTFPDLDNIRSLVAQQACKVSETPSDQHAAQEQCRHKPAEIAFVLDKSNSVYINDFKKQLTFVNDVIDILDIGPTKTRVAAVSFSVNATVEYHLDEFSSKQDIKDRTAKIIYTGGITTETRLALLKVRDEVFSLKHGYRVNVPHIVIVITDGRSQAYQETKAVAKTIKENGVHMFAIGVGNSTDTQELKDIGSLPSDLYVFEVDGYSALNTIKNILAYRACGQKP